MLVEIKVPAFGVVLDLVYATDKNFTGKRIYKREACFLHPDAAESLHKASMIAGALGLRFKIFDGFRPTEAQWILWEHTPNPEFVADPGVGSLHSRGIAVDLTLIDEQNHELPMGTAFDDFTPLSHHGVTSLSVEAQKNRLLLLGIMTAAGWNFYPNEWWHYQLQHPKCYPLLSDEEAGTGLM